MTNPRIQTFLAVPILFGSYFPLPPRVIFRHIRNSDFDGVELLLTNYVLEHLEELAALAKEAGLEVRFHSWWPTGKDIDGWHNKVVTPHLFPQAGVRLPNRIPACFHCPVVVCSYDLNSLEDYDLLAPRAVFQPTPTGTYVVPFNELLNCVREEGVRLVFDVGHWLQYHYHASGSVPEDVDSDTLHAVLTTAFDGIIDQVDEIHLYQVDEFNASGMNRWPWAPGRLDLDRFLGHVRSTGWVGVLTVELSPFQMFPLGFHNLRLVPQYIRSHLG